MTDQLTGRVAIITGAGRGIGREHALLFAAEGGYVVVNDVGSDTSGQGSDGRPAQVVVDAIRSLGGEAVANFDDVTSMDGAHALVEQAIRTYGRLDILVNNAGILRDRMLVNMSEAEWDDVFRVHVKGHFATTRWAAEHWRERAKNGELVKAALINTTSTSGLLGSVGQTNYGAAKSAIATFTLIADAELSRYGVRSNAIAPAARTRLTAGNAAVLAAVVEDFDIFDAANVSPFVAYLATESCPIAGKVFFVIGGKVHLFRPWSVAETISSPRRWTIEELASTANRFAGPDFDFATEI